jgi:uncharacterized protein with GYD domain
MPHYLVQVSYTPEAWQRLVKQPQNRIDQVRPSVEKMGGKLVGGWFAFGEQDVVAVFDLPSNVSAAALSIAFAAGGAIKNIRTTPLITPEEAVEAMRKAGATGYKPPGA